MFNQISEVRTHSFQVANTMVAADLVTHGAKASITMLQT